MASKTIAIATALVLLAVAAPAAAEDPVPEPNCYQIYNEYHAGPVTVIQRSSCEYEVYVFGEPLIG